MKRSIHTGVSLYRAVLFISPIPVFQVSKKNVVEQVFLKTTFLRVSGYLDNFEPIKMFAY